MTNWGKFESVDAKALNEETKNLKDGDFPEIPNGKYEVSIEKMELRPTKKTGAPMLSVNFKILNGDYKGQHVFMNQVVIMGDENDKYRLHTANTFLRSLGTEIDIQFEGVSAYEALIEQVYGAVHMNAFEFLLEIGENKSGYKTYKILEVFETE